MHEELWAGVDLKIDNARFQLEGMGRSLQPPERTAVLVALEASGAMIDGNWHRAFYAHLDAFLSAARSVPEIIQCCFGVDRSNAEMRAWFDGLDPGERDRRQKFKDQFQVDYDAFRALPLGTARHISEHRRGFAPVTATVNGRFGVTYTGGPIRRLPTSETRPVEPEYGWLVKAQPLRPNWADFSIEGQPLFPACQDFENRAQALLDRARALAQQVHDSNSITPPPP
jgi:hypothetical protein